MGLTKKIDFAIIIKVKNANPNGDPLNGNRPRTNYENQGEITDVCLKRKIRDRLQESGQEVFVQSDEKKKDDMKSLEERAEKSLGEDAFNGKNNDKAVAEACKKWFDVRSFGQVFPFGKKKSSKKEGDNSEEKGAAGVSISVRGPLTIQSAFSTKPIDINSLQITKSVNTKNKKDGSSGKSSDTMGMKHRVEGEAVYVTYGAMTPQLAEKTGFSDEDAKVIKNLLPKLFEGDASSARPEGSMKVEKVIWWEHNSKAGQYSSAKVHGSLTVKDDGTYELNNLGGLTPQEIDGF